MSLMPASTRPLGSRLQVQRLDAEPPGPRAAHLDLARGDLAAEVRRHLELGASLVRPMPHWVTLLDQAGLPYCVTRRDPATTRLRG